MRNIIGGGGLIHSLVTAFREVGKLVRGVEGVRAHIVLMVKGCNLSDWLTDFPTVGMEFYNIFINDFRVALDDIIRTISLMIDSMSTTNFSMKQIPILAKYATGRN